MGVSVCTKLNMYTMATVNLYAKIYFYVYALLVYT